MSLKKFACPCCGAELTFDAEIQKMSCEYCGTELEVEAVEALVSNTGSSENIQWDEYSGQEMKPDDGSCSYTCNSCGAEIIGDKTLAASECPYCGSPVIMGDKFDGILKPDLIIPFKVKKEEATKKFKEFCQHRPLLPTGFMNNHKIESIEGMYVPYWLFDCGCKANVRFKGERISSWREGSYQVTKTDHFMLLRNGSMEFDRVPVDGISKLPNEITEAVEPYTTAEAVAYNDAYLSGYLADRYDEDSEACKPRANERIKSSIIQAMTVTTTDYTAVTYQGGNIDIENGKINYALFPMWILTAKYEGKNYTFALNGQTGRFVGELPVSMKKFVGMLLGIGAGLSVVLALIAQILLH
ncbi:MAG: hypothetical protein ACI4Q6_06135 [Huintestinicola sp.]